VLGFIGTVLGLSLAIGRFTQTLQAGGDLELIRASLQGVTGGLATAFESTLVALTFTLILQLVITFQQKREMAFLDECNDYCHSHIVAKLRLIDRHPAMASMAAAGRSEPRAEARAGAVDVAATDAREARALPSSPAPAAPVPPKSSHEPAPKP
jgi:hypothetical protein